MSALIGSTGFVGGHFQKSFEFTHKFNRSNISELQGLDTDLLICAGLPAEKWKANNDPESDWSNMANLAQLVSTVDAEQAVLISTVDVYQPAIHVCENDQPSLNGKEAYGRNRAWFESFFVSHFPHATIIRLPGLFGKNLKKNFIYDLVNGRDEQYLKVNKESQFQFFDISLISEIVLKALANNVPLLNVATEPLFAQDIAEIFNKKLTLNEPRKCYDMQTIHGKIFERESFYIQSKEEVMSGIVKLMQNSRK
jgi:dTDP-4-dehydrorhamnose reductase